MSSQQIITLIPALILAAYNAYYGQKIMALQYGQETPDWWNLRLCMLALMLLPACFAANNIDGGIHYAVVGLTIPLICFAQPYDDWVCSLNPIDRLIRRIQ
ncbi:hypothetical protein [Bifidobacterium callitrichidarum]|uniref:Uncharacterized protein n=1 Tax=Bifidobacterium callitrichidarum TaxID=2052941 RepID=A0A2U2N8Y7_9BIFI|nr:hypothetical protein [Bifidobacterium callitrichidarum]PWG65578.1 hypothetical protein DF196_06485 [Bifidobacterium callitrichidarum]